MNSSNQTKKTMGKKTKAKSAQVKVDKPDESEILTPRENEDLLDQGAKTIFETSDEKPVLSDVSIKFEDTPEEHEIDRLEAKIKNKDKLIEAQSKQIKDIVKSQGKQIKDLDEAIRRLYELNHMAYDG